MKKFFLLLFLCLVSTLSFAVPAKRVTFTHTQKDGTVLSLMFVGDEHMHYYKNTVTGEAMSLSDDGDYYVIPAMDFSARQQMANQRRIEANQRRIQRLPFQGDMSRLHESTKNGKLKALGQFNTITGSKKGLVILVNFSDKAMQASHDQSAFNDMFNKEGYSENGHIGSVHDYFKDQSYNQFDLTFDVVGPVTLPNNMAFYGGNDRNGNDLRPAQMAKEACEAVNSSVNFADYDWDGDGYVDQVFIIYAGYGENYYGADSNTIWPHEWDLQSGGVGVLTLDGVKIKTYACAAELYATSGTDLNGIGTAVHEFSHCLGYPDTYDTDYSGGIGMDSYDVMCGGSYNGPEKMGEVPVGYTAYERWCAGWLTPTELKDPSTITGMSALNDAGAAYVIYNSSNTNEYLLLENRQSRDWFQYYDYKTAGHGLFVMHVDYNATVWSNNRPNDDPNHQRMCWIPADGKYGTYSSTQKSWTISDTEQQGDFFPGTKGITTLDGTSHTTVGGKWFTATTFPHSLTEISESNGEISFLFDGGSQDDGSRYTITLNACGGSVSPTSWTQTSYKQSYTLPEPEPTVEGWYGAGWSTKEITEDTPLDDIEDFIDYGKSYTPESNVTLYAVYMDEDFICNSYPANTYYTVIFDAGTGSCDVNQWQQTDAERKVTLPTATSTISGWEFVGWSTAAVDETTEKPVIMSAGKEYRPLSDGITLYAVYKKVEKAPVVNTFKLVNTLTAGRRYVFVTRNTEGSAYAISKENLSDLSVQPKSAYTTKGASITVSKENTDMVVEPTADMIWVCTSSSGVFNLKNENDYLGINGNGIGKRTSAVSLWWLETSGLYGKNSKGNKTYYAQLTNNGVIQTSTNATSTNRIYAYEAPAVGSDITTYNSNPGLDGMVTAMDADWYTYGSSEAFIVPEGIEAYIALPLVDNNFSLVPIAAGETVAAGEGIAFKCPTASAGNNVNVHFLKSSATPSDVENIFIGSSEDVVVDHANNDYYIFATTTASGVGMYHYAGTRSIPAHKAYICLPKGVAPQAYFSIAIDGSATTVQSPATGYNQPTTGFYNLAGQKVDGSFKGIIIKGGKKYIKK